MTLRYRPRGLVRKREQAGGSRYRPRGEASRPEPSLTDRIDGDPSDQLWLERRGALRDRTVFVIEGTAGAGATSIPLYLGGSSQTLGENKPGVPVLARTRTDPSRDQVSVSWQATSDTPDDNWTLTLYQRSADGTSYSAVATMIIDTSL